MSDKLDAIKSAQEMIKTEICKFPENPKYDAYEELRMLIDGIELTDDAFKEIGKNVMWCLSHELFDLNSRPEI